MKPFIKFPCMAGIALVLCMAACSEEPEEVPQEQQPTVQEPECTVTVCADTKILNTCTEDGHIVQKDCSAEGKVCKGDACVEAETELIPDKPECTQTVCDEDEDTLIECNEGVIVSRNKCSDQGMICKDNACTKKPIDPPGCTTSMCEGNILFECVNGKVVKKDCEQSGLVCLNKICSIKPCEEGTKECDGDKLMTCGGNGRMVLETDCRQKGMACLEDTESNSFACQEVECFDDEYQPLCMTKSERKICKDHKIITEQCQNDEYCAIDKCVKDPCASCGPKQYCIDEECVDNLPDTLIGIPCKCESYDCDTHLTGLDIKKDAFQALLATVLQTRIPDDSEIVIPDFFSPSTRGCEVLNDVVPEGMTVGCFRDADVTFDEAIKTFFADKTYLSSILSIGLSGNDELVEKILQIVDNVSEFMEEGARYIAPGGYCMTSALDIDGKVESATAQKAFKPNAFTKGEGTFVNRFITGDHKTVVEKSKQNDNYCPAGSKLFSYDLEKKIPQIGPFKIGYDMCLKSCNADKDCREGYSCIGIPTSIPSSLNFDEASKSKACFNQENIDTIKKLLGLVLNVMKN